MWVAPLSTALVISQRSSLRLTSSMGPTSRAACSHSSTVRASNSAPVGSSSTSAPSTLGPAVSGMVHTAPVPCCWSSSACARVTWNGPSLRAGNTTVASWSAASSMAPSMARARLVFLAKAALCESARSWMWRPFMKPMLTRSQPKVVASSVTTAVAAAWKRSCCSEVAISSSTVTRRALLVKVLRRASASSQPMPQPSCWISSRSAASERPSTSKAAAPYSSSSTRIGCAKKTGSCRRAVRVRPSTATLRCCRAFSTTAASRGLPSTPSGQMAAGVKCAEPWGRSTTMARMTPSSARHWMSSQLAAKVCASEAWARRAQALDSKPPGWESPAGLRASLRRVMVSSPATGLPGLLAQRNALLTLRMSLSDSVPTACFRRMR